MAGMKITKYSAIEDIVKSSFSYAEVLRKLGIVPAGGNYGTLKRVLTARNLDISHFTLKGWSKGKKFPGARSKPISEYLVKGTPYSSHRLRMRLIDSGLKAAACESCGLTHWLGEPIPLELDHMDGDHDNNELANLRIVCSLCHALSPNFRAKNRASAKYKRLKELATEPKVAANYIYERKPREKLVTIKPVPAPKPNCKLCGKECSYGCTRCKKCTNIGKNLRIEWPSTSDLVATLKEKSCLSVAKELGVSDNAIRKRLKRQGITTW